MGPHARVVPPVFVTGGTGYLGRPLIVELLKQGYAVHALVRQGSEGRLPPGALAVRGDALDASTFAEAIPRGATLVHLVGTPHPGHDSEAVVRPRARPPVALCAGPCVLHLAPAQGDP